jgi:hypothetical protein
LNRPNRIAALVLTGVGVVFIVGVIFGTGVMLGAHVGGDRGDFERSGNGSETSGFDRGGPPMGDMGSWEFPAGGAPDEPNGAEGPSADGGPGAAPGQPPQSTVPAVPNPGPNRP